MSKMIYLNRFKLCMKFIAETVDFFCQAGVKTKKVKINNQWYDAELIKNTRELLQSLNILRKNEKS